METSQTALLAITLVAYVCARRLYTKFTIIPFFPLVTAPLLIILLLSLNQTSIQTYQDANKLISFFVGPATVAFAIPLYRQWQRIKAIWVGVVLGISLGSAVGLVLAVVTAKYLGADKAVAVSLAAKSTTMPIAVAITKQLNGIETISVFSVVATAIIGGAIGPEFLRLLKVKDPVAMGLGLGAAAHASGTARAFQLGEVEGSFSGAALVLAGLATALLAPWLIKYLI